MTPVKQRQTGNKQRHLLATFLQQSAEDVEAHSTYAAGRDVHP
jgi:hypothetical protein